jgi:rhomboid protease GluP
LRSSTQTYFGGSLSKAPVTVALLAINVLVFALLEITGGSTDSVNLYRWGAKYGPAIADGEWWRLALPIFMHIGFFHLLTNSLGLLIFGSVVERIYGSVAYAAIYLVTGIVGNLASFVVSPALGAGASGAVFGIVGAFAVYLLLNRKLMGEMGRQALITVGFIVGLNLVLGFSQQGIDNAAHVGGLLAGGVMGYLISPRQKIVIEQVWSDFGPPRMALKTQAQAGWLIALAVAAGIAVTVIGVYIRSQDYPDRDVFKAAGYSFMDFSDPQTQFRRFN